MNRKMQKMISEGRFGVGKDYLPEQEWISSGSYVLDYALGGGYPLGTVIEVFGPPSSGKSLLSLVAEANVTQQGKYVLHCDLEGNHATQELNSWRESFGVDMNYVIQKDNAPAEEVIDDTVLLLKEAGQDCPLMVVDSIGVLCSGDTLSKKADEKNVAVEARLVRKWLAQLRQVNKHTAIILINHEVAKIGTYMGGKTTKGGDAPKFYSFLRLAVKGSAVQDPRGALYGAIQHDIDVKVVKNKISVPGRSAHMVFDYKTMSFDKTTELLQLAEPLGIVESKPPMYSMVFKNEEVKFKGREAFKNYLKETPEAVAYLESKIFK